jgi:hypothetical protein
VHLVFHVSQLKHAVSASVQVSGSLPSELTGVQVPGKILQRRLVNRGDRTVLQALIKWSDSPTSLATWEDVEPLCQCFPRAAAWGQACAYGGGDVMTPVTTVAGNEDEAREGTGPSARRQSTRKAKTNSKVIGLEWL